MSTTSSLTENAVFRGKESSEGGVHIQRALRDFYLSQIAKAQQSVKVSKARMEVLRDALSAANDALTEISSLLVKVPETSNNAKLKDYAAKNPDELRTAQRSLFAYQIRIAALLFPTPGTPGTSRKIVDGSDRAFYDPPFTGVRLPDLSHLQSRGVNVALDPWILNLMPVTDLNRTSIVLAQRGGPTAYWDIDPGKHDGASISKTVKVLQAEIQALNQAFQMESADAASALSTENSIREGSKTAMDKCFRILADTLGARA